ncbi:hypothetical protein HAX54_047625, partial [Datura stramonium]|nr:hypothetical protein [Datura stramonium]
GSRREWMARLVAVVSSPCFSFYIVLGSPRLGLGNLKFLKSGILPGHIRYSGCSVVITGPLQRSVPRCSESAA